MAIVWFKQSSLSQIDNHLSNVFLCKDRIKKRNIVAHWFPYRGPLKIDQIWTKYSLENGIKNILMSGDTGRDIGFSSINDYY